MRCGQRSTSTATTREAAITAVKAIVEEAGIQPYVAESALPHLHPDDIHLVAWMAVTPSGH